MGCEQLVRGCIKSSAQETIIERVWYVHSWASAGYSSPKKVDSGAYPEWTCGLGRKTPTRGVHVSLKGNRCALEHVAVVGGLQQLTQWSRGAV